MSYKRTLESRIFLLEIQLLCMKHGLSLSHEDTQGAFIVTEYSEENVEWLMAALERRDTLQKSERKE
jgi:hypothetical protein